jgi:hypothetical protein
MSPNTKKQKALRRIERAVGATMPPEIYTPLSMLRAVDIEAFATWVEDAKSRDTSEKPRDSVVPIDDFEA